MLYLFYLQWFESYQYLKTKDSFVAATLIFVLHKNVTLIKVYLFAYFRALNEVVLMSPVSQKFCSK